MCVFIHVHFYQNVAAFPSSAKSRNPFDIEDDPRPVQGATVCTAANFIWIRVKGHDYCLLVAAF